MSRWPVYVEGVGLWSPQLADFASLRAWLAGTPLPPASRSANCERIAGQRTPPRTGKRVACH